LGRRKVGMGLRLVIVLGRMGKLTVVKMIESKRSGGVYDSGRVFSECVAASRCILFDH
jgi:hypothetical protein